MLMHKVPVVGPPLKGDYIMLKDEFISQLRQTVCTGQLADAQKHSFQVRSLVAGIHRSMRVTLTSREI